MEEGMRRIAATLLLSAVALSAGVSTASAQSSPRWFPFGGKHSGPLLSGKRTVATPVITDPSVELAAMQSRTVTVPAGTDVTAGPAAAGPPVQMVNSRNLVIDFELKNLGPSGVGAVELWYTRNGQVWFKSPGAPQTQSPFVLDVSEDGLYGFAVVASNGMGIGKSAPQTGDPPQVWVDVDTTRPEVRLLSTRAGADEIGRTLILKWSASDRNLVPRPITLSYAENPDGPWIPFATNVENSGSYVWHMSPGLPQHVLVRAEATDRVGNSAGDQSNLPAPVDLNRPTATIRNVTRNGSIQPVGGN